MEKLKRVKRLLGHQLKDFSQAFLLDKLCDLAIMKYDPREKAARVSKNRKPAAVTPTWEITPRAGFTPAQETKRYIPAALKRAIWSRDQGRCTNYGTTAHRECDHCVPFALGGPTQLDNLRLLCRACNSAAAIRVFGQKHMDLASKSGPTKKHEQTMQA